jgi:membrane protein
VIGIITLLIGATGVFGELQSDLDRIWHAPAAARPSGLWGLIRTRLLTLGMVAAIGFLLLVSLIVSAMLSALGNWWGSWFEGRAILLQLVNQLSSFAIITVLFALMYRILPSVTVAWRDVWMGSAATALLFTVGKYAVGAYIGHAAVTSGFGAAGSIVVVLVWVYYSAQLFLLGAEFTWVYAHRQGSRAGEEPAADKTAAVAPPRVQPERGWKETKPQTTEGRSGASPAEYPTVTRPAPRGWEFVYAGMVSAAFGFAHWYLRTHPSIAEMLTQPYADAASSRLLRGNTSRPRPPEPTTRQT